MAREQDGGLLKTWHLKWDRMDLLPALVSLLSRLLTGVGDEAKSCPAFHRKSDLTATLSGLIQLPLNHMLNTSHWRWDRANSEIECLSLCY
jgi:hypothetical protein